MLKADVGSEVKLSIDLGETPFKAGTRGSVLRVGVGLREDFREVAMLGHRKILHIDFLDEVGDESGADSGGAGGVGSGGGGDVGTGANDGASDEAGACESCGRSYTENQGTAG